jgi:hypothetical protein
VQGPHPFAQPGRQHLVELGQSRDCSGLDAGDGARRRQLKPECCRDRLVVVEQ